MKKILIGLFLLLIIAFSTSTPIIAYAKEAVDINDMANKLNTEEMDEIISSLTEDQKSIFNAQSFKDKLLSIVSGESDDGILSFILSSLNLSVKEVLPFIFSLLGICIALGVMKAFCGESKSGVYTVIRFVFILLCCTILFSQLTSVIISVKDLVSQIKQQIDGIFPILLTLMSAIGSSKSVLVYQPVIAILSSGIMKIITVLVLPCFILSIVFEVASNLSDKVNLKNMAAFFSSSMKWLLGTAFFAFLAFLSVKGVTAAVYDGIHIRATKFALNKYIPIIGGYLSEGYNLVFSGGVIIKNGVGLCAIVLLLSVLLPIFMKILLLSLSTDLLSALSQPIGAEEASNLFKGVSKGLKNLLAIVFGASFLYFIFLLLIICTGNASL